MPWKHKEGQTIFTASTRNMSASLRNIISEPTVLGFSPCRHIMYCRGGIFGPILAYDYRDSTDILIAGTYQELTKLWRLLGGVV